MAFENNGILKKWHMTNTPPKIDKYNTHKNWCLTKMAHIAKNAQSKGHMPGAELSNFLKGILQFLV